MSNVYPYFKTLCLTTGGNLLSTSTPVDCALISVTTGTTGNNYAYNPAHQYFSSVPAGSRLAQGAVLTGTAVNNGNFQCSSVTFSSVPAKSSQQVEAIIFYSNTTVEATSQLVCYVDSSTSSGFPITPGGGSITVSFTGNLIVLA